MIVKYDEDNFSIKLYRDFVKGKLVGLMEVIPIEELLDVWEKHKAEQTEPQTHEIRTNTHECVKDTHDKTEPQGIVLPRKGCHRPIELPCHSEQGDGYCANCIYWHEDFEGVAYGKPQTGRSDDGKDGENM